ncbi:MAG: S8 family serine peptidase [Saprospiraceae bacterium]|nr:S8 family serine peptidase [Saprospiraceae bacterium]
MQVYADVQIESQIICPGSPPLGSDSTVENLLKVPALKSCGMTGKGVKVAIVDTGVNMSYLNSQGKNPGFDAANSWKPSSSTVVPGSAPVDHGTMCAFDVCIAAPDCTILDIALLTTQRSGSTVMEGFLSDAILAYRHLLNILATQGRPGENKSLVVNNSWGMFHPSWDYPVGHPGNYSDNPNHPFNQIVHTLERAGADILFAAGNCGKDCPDGRCQGITANTIYGANSSPYVTCVAGVDTTKKRVGYSAIGPGRLTNKKPDIAGYTHFSGSGVYSADGGTSAACPVTSGVVAAIRTKRPLNTSDPATSPSAIRSLMFSAAEDLGPTGYDYLHGHGVVSTQKMIDKICKSEVPPICVRYPWICQWLCRYYPHLCTTNGPLAGIEPTQETDMSSTLEKFFENPQHDDELILGFLAGLLLQKSDAVAKADNPESGKKKDCGCNG